MTRFEIATIIMGSASMFILPMLAIILRVMSRWVKTEDKLDILVGNVRELVIYKDREHDEMLAQMKLDRDATNIRLRYLEEYFMSHGMGKGQMLCLTKSGKWRTLRITVSTIRIPEN